MLINWPARQLNIKIVYYGPALSGKTTNIEQIYQRIDPARRGDLVSLKTNEDRTLFFDFLQIELGKICGLTPKIALYTVPGQSYYEASRKVVLRGVDGVVFVADSGAEKMPENLLAWQNLFEQLQELGASVAEMPVVVQLNKRDVFQALPTQDLTQELGDGAYPVVEAQAKDGVGVHETFKTVVSLVMARVQKNIR